VSEQELQIEVEPDLEGRIVVVVRGALDLVEAADLRTVLTRVCGGDCPHVVLDLTNVTFVGSSALGVIVQARNDLAEQDRTLLLRGTSGAIRRAFELTHLDRVIDFEEDAQPEAH
jgi:anti-sigma B factor antagonist